MIAFVFPFLSFSPWQMRSTPKIFGVARKLRGIFQEENVAEGDIVRKFLLENGKFPTMSPDVVWKMLYFGKRLPFSHSLSSDTWTCKRKREREGGREKQTEDSLGRKANFCLV